MSDLEECYDFYHTIDSSGYWTRSSFTAIEPYWQCTSDSTMRDIARSRMPPDLLSQYESSYDPIYFLSSARDQFSSSQGPPWFSAMPEEVQTYFVTNMMSADQELLDWGGTSLVEYDVLASTTINEQVTTVGVTMSITVSREVRYMSVLSEAFPGYINAIIASSSPSAAATAIYSEFTGGIAPPWFNTLPYDVKTFLVLDFIPNYRQGHSMRLRILGETTTTFRTSTSPRPGSTPTSGPASTTPVTSSAIPTQSSARQAPTPDSHQTTIIAGIVVPCAFLIAAALAVFLVSLRRKRRGQKYNAAPLCPTDPENGAPVKRTSTLDQLPASPHPQYQHSASTNLPEVDMSPAFGGDLRVLKRRSRSATDLRGWTSWPGLGHEDVPDLPPRSASAMSVRIVRPDE